MPFLSRILHPRDEFFFDLFEEAADNVHRAAELLDEMLQSFPESSHLARDILDCEHEGDRITHDIIHRLAESPATPIDGENIYALASALDDIVDYAEEVADYLGLYRIEAPMEQGQQLARVLVEATAELAAAMPRLRDLSDLGPHTAKIKRLENKGDEITREAIASLFRAGIDPMIVIRWKDIYERLEAAIDATERVANILDGIVLKNA